MGANVEAAANDKLSLRPGVCVPLLLMCQQADSPVVQGAATWDTPRGYFELGRALQPLAQEGVLLVGSGGLVHNLHDVMSNDGPTPDWAADFSGWCAARLKEGDWDALCDYRRLAPEATRAHPTEDHFLPLFFAGGAGGKATLLHDSFAYGRLSMATYGFA